MSSLNERLKQRVETYVLDTAPRAVNYGAFIQYCLEDPEIFNVDSDIKDLHHAMNNAFTCRYPKLLAAAERMIDSPLWKRVSDDLTNLKNAKSRQILKEEAIAETEVSAIKFTKRAIENSVEIASEIMRATSSSQKRKNDDEIGSASKKQNSTVSVNGTLAVIDSAMFGQLMKEVTDSKRESIQIQKDMYNQQLKTQERHHEEVTRLKMNNIHILSSLERLQRSHDVRGTLGI
ncbi:hypothetical protein BDR26DRAFT_850308 [Obelidium mucronatum]|nr:hypothetical protein BDR26DRAFT_850308 [Obelidium mucronatum]